MAEETKAGAPQNLVIQMPLQAARPAYYREIYASGFSFRATMSDFSLVFLSLASMPGALNTMVNQEEGAVTMTLPTLKILSENLSAAVKAFEERLGPIKVDKRMRVRPENIQALIAGLDPNYISE